LSELKVYVCIYVCNTHITYYKAKRHAVVNHSHRTAATNEL